MGTNTLNSKVKQASGYSELFKGLSEVLEGFGSKIAPIAKYQPELYNKELKAIEEFERLKTFQPTVELKSFNPSTSFTPPQVHPAVIDAQDNLNRLYAERKYLPKRRDVDPNRIHYLNEKIDKLEKEYKNKLGIYNEHVRSEKSIYDTGFNKEKSIHDAEQANVRQQIQLEQNTYNNNYRDVQARLQEIANEKSSWNKSVGAGVSGLVVGGGAAAAGLAGKLLSNRRAERALAGLAPEAREMVGGVSTLADIGLSPRDAKDYVEMQLKNKEMHLKDLETHKTGLETARIQNELEKQDTVLGRLNRSSFGQFIGPIAGGALVTSGGLAAMKVMDTAKNMGVPDPTVELSVRRNLANLLESKPELKNVDRALLLDYYRLIFRIAPSVGRNTHVAANLLVNMVNYGGANHVLMKELADTERALKDPSRMQMDYMNSGNQLFGLAR